MVSRCGGPLLVQAVNGGKQQFDGGHLEDWYGKSFSLLFFVTNANAGLGCGGVGLPAWGGLGIGRVPE